MDFSSLNHLKVADLKQHLRQRGLSITGNKTELIQRLGQALVNDSGLLTASNSIPQTTTTILQQQQIPLNVSKISNNNEIDEDAILGDDDDVDDDVDDETSNSELIDDKIPNEDLLLGDHIHTTSSTNISADTSTSINNSETEQKSKTMIKQTSTTAKDSSNLAESKSMTTATTTTLIPSLKQLATKITSIPLASEERKRLRQLKFADPKLVNRVQRFGAQQQSTIKKLIEPSEDGKLLKRVERFGEIVSNKAKTLNERERIERRKQRFGGAGGGGGGAISTTKVSAVGSSVPASSENIRKRQDRFGVVEKPVSNQTLSNQNNNNNFKRRRFAY